MKSRNFTLYNFFQAAFLKKPLKIVEQYVIEMTKKDTFFFGMISKLHCSNGINVNKPHKYDLMVKWSFFAFATTLV